MSSPGGPARPGGRPRGGVTARVGIDVGGTFTDFVLTSSTPGGEEAVFHHKEPSTPEDPSMAVAVGLAVAVERAGLLPEQLTSLTHGTTIGLNTIIQRSGARIALVVTDGYRDILEIGRSRMPSSFDLHASKEEPLVPRERIVEIGARLRPDGTPLLVPDDAELARVAADLARTGADAAAVVLLHGYTNPTLEAEVAARIQERLPKLPVVSSAAIWPEIREYERTLVTCLNVYIQPLMRAYFGRLESRLRDLGVDAPIYITASNGGSLGLGSATQRPIDTVLSGPAAGVMAAARLAREAGIDRVVTFDMGGTSSDIAISVAGEPEFATHTTVGGLPLILPVVAVSAIGAGGGSVVWVDAHGVLKVGPTSAGADPGPASYGRGGVQPTVTDCYLATGIIDPDTFLGGRMRLDLDAASAALGKVATGLGADDAHEAADAALRVATAEMATELQKLLASRGLDPADFTLVPFGGAGPTHAAMLAQEVGIRRVVVPPDAATFCALGAVGADLRRDFARSLRRWLDEESATALRQTLGELADQAQDWLDSEGQAAGAPVFLRSADMRYAGQAYELRVKLDAAVDELDQATIAEAFHLEHERLYGFRDTSAPIELGTARLAIIAPVGEVFSTRLPGGTGTVEPRGRRQVLLHATWVGVDVYDRATLRAGDAFDGPAIVEQDDTTIVVPPGWAVTVDGPGNLNLARND